MSGLLALEQEIRLLSVARQEIVARGYDISPDSANLLQGLIATGAWELASDRLPPPNDIEAQRDPGGTAEKRVRTWVWAMVDAAQALGPPGQASRLLTETTFRGAFAKLCPLWPFC
jgi:hypothetical protein